MTEKKYYWIKLKTDFFNQEAIDFLMSQQNGCQYIVLYQMLCLQTANTNGVMATQIGEVIVPYDVKKIVRDTKYFDFDTVTVALELFKRLGLVYQDDGDILRITNLNHMVGSESASQAAIKKREYRERLKDKKEDIIEDKKRTNCPTENRDKSLENRDKILEIEKREKINYQEIVDMYNDTCVSFPRVTTLSEQRKKAIKARLNNYSIDDFKTLFEKAENSTFLKGGNGRNWSANFDWLIKDSNIAKVLDGNYDNKSNPAAGQKAQELNDFYNMAKDWAESEGNNG